MKVDLKKTKSDVGWFEGRSNQEQSQSVRQMGQRSIKNSVMCSKCGKWVHGKSAKTKSNLNSSKRFYCERCVEAIKRIVEPSEELTFYDQVELVQSFRYLAVVEVKQW